VTTTDAGLTSLVTQLGRARASAMDVPAVLGSICSAIPGVLGVGGAVLLLVNPPDGVPAITASDARALWLAETQQRTDMGPLPGALRTWRPMLTTDLARIGPPAVATAAAECGLGSSLVLPFDVDGDRVGVLQVLGEVQRPVEAAHAEVLRPLLDVLGARLADVRALRRPRATRPTDDAPSGTGTGGAPDSTASAGRSGPPTPGPNGATGPRSSNSLPPTRNVPAQSGATRRQQAPFRIPAPRTTPAGKHVDDEQSLDPSSVRRPRRGAHAAPEAGDPSESTTRSLPTIPPRPVMAARPEPTSLEVSGKPNRNPPVTPRTGRHSV
jgi:GAF domain